MIDTLLAVLPMDQTMEIEAKFAVPDASIARGLRRVGHIDGFLLSAPTRMVVRDTFFDTRENDLLNTRHVLRVRQRRDGRTLITFKAPALRKAGYHVRPETEEEISLAHTPRALRVSELPARVRKLVAPLTQDEILYPMFSISQTRETRMIRQGRRIIAEWSLDNVRFRSGEKKRAFYELEIELKKSGTEQELQRIAEWTAREFHLQSVPFGKFARAVEFMRGA
jgi:inorganic triphosphatase YgiF